ncbi:hypothetical protein Cantr_03027 [Candida viswanathii]|uniref:Peptide N-acetyl-beta-D-glucosaminyl asparaginase amidase A N-terminal domain-containing protein n=1 Tax=Candida viswanathii TaxID=5486 RepID=A0A367YPE1_9ASCO|nr:hypothetical protein Cantr_03027 [Candida viswanathii]
MSAEDKRPDEKLPSGQTELPPYSDISKAAEDEKQPFLTSDEKVAFEEESVNHDVPRSTGKFKHVLRLLALFSVIYVVNFVYLNFDELRYGLTHFKFDSGTSRVPTKPLDHHPLFRNLIDTVDTGSSEQEGEDASKAREIISVGNPFVPPPFFGKSKYSTKLLHHKFGNSWGKPAVVNFTAPSDVSFDGVVLTLHTEVDGVQYDRLANLFVDGIQIWRTSTIEPGGRKTFSDVKKDVSKYSKLFKKKNVPILFQLDNLLTDKLTGTFDVTLTIDLYDFHGFGPHHHSLPHHGGEHHRDHAGKHRKGNKDKRDGESDGDGDDDKKPKEPKEPKKPKKPDHPPHEPHHPPHGPDHPPHEPHHPPHDPDHPPHDPDHPPHDPDHPPHDPDHPHIPHHRFHKEREIFATPKPADQVYPLTFSSKPNVAPIVYLASGRLAVELPKVSKNTTRLQLSIFTSGNAADEFWYSNVLDKFTDVFADEGNQFLGRGPARVVNVYFNGKKIVTQTPEPVIFTGGISPALWSPVVSYNAFDVPSIDVDVTGLLPLLWKHQAASDRTLEIEISNGLGEVGKDDSVSVNENWITTANLLTFENDQVVESSGEIINVDDSGWGHAIGISPHFTRSFQQVVDVSLKAQLISNIVLKLKNKKVLNTTISSYSEAEIANVQNYGRSGDRQSVVHVGHSSQSILIQDNDFPEKIEGRHGRFHAQHEKPLPDNTVFAVNVSLSYPLVLNVNQFAKEIGSDGQFSVDLDVKLVHSTGLDVSLGGGFGNINTGASQNGTSHFVISSKGNHGDGATTSKYKAKARFGGHGRRYERIVDAVNGTITSDRTNTERDDENKKFASVVEVLEHTSKGESAFDFSDRILKALRGKSGKSGRTRTPCHAHGGIRGMRGHRGDVRHPGAH